MFRQIIIILAYVILTTGYVYPALPSQLPSPSPQINNLEPIKKSDRILVIAPHPDDEVIGCAGIIQEAVKVGADIHIAYLTNGDHNEFAFIIYEKRLTLRKTEFIYLGEVRRSEAIRAMELLGLNEKNLIFLGYPDFGTFVIFSQHWQDTKPCRSLLTRISAVPYKENLSFQAPYRGESILADFKKLLLTYKPNKIFISHPADTNVDHKSAYLFLQVALADVEKIIPKPKIYPYLIHCVGWPLPRHYHPELPLAPPKKFLDSPIQWLKYDLDQEKLNKKYRAILCYKSQTESSAFYLLSFAREDELFGDYPPIELTLQLQGPTTGTEKQGPLEYKAISFSGSSNMFADSVIGEINSLGNLTKGKEQVSYALSDSSFLIRMDKTKERRRRLNIVFYLFGYNHKTPFANMPKIRIITKYNKFKVFDARKMIKPEGITLELNTKELILKIPLKILGEPDFVLTSVRAHTGILSFDTIGFRKINIK